MFFGCQIKGGRVLDPSVWHTKGSSVFLLSERQQCERDNRERYEDQNPDQVGAHEIEHGLVGFHHRRIPVHRVDHKEVHANWRCDQTDLDNDQDKDSEPDRRVWECFKLGGSGLIGSRKAHGGCCGLVCLFAWRRWDGGDATH